MTLSRRNMLGGLIATLTAPAIVRSISLMPVRGIVMPVDENWVVKATEVHSFGYIDVRALYTVLGWNQFGNRVIETIRI